MFSWDKRQKGFPMEVIHVTEWLRVLIFFGDQQQHLLRPVLPDT